MASVSQRFGSKAGLPETKFIDPTTVAFTKNIKSAASMDEAISQTEKTVMIHADDGGLQKPVSTPRSNNQSWQKKDNADPNIRRLAILIETDDGNPGFKESTDALAGSFTKQSPEAFAASKDSKKNEQFRVDNVIRVKPLTVEERRKGVTMTQKIEDAFKQAQSFQTEQQKKAGDQADQLKFEVFTSWMGHGMTDSKKSPKDTDPRINQEGSAEFIFMPDVTKRDKDGRTEEITETQIKDWEERYLKRFRYGVQYFGSCSSGAAIS